jgi:hypothetical protein
MARRRGNIDGSRKSREVSRDLARRFAEIARRIYPGGFPRSSDVDEDVVRLPARSAPERRSSLLPRDDRESREDD